MSSITALRRQLQDPRKPYDTFYGKLIMRPLSIYITWALKDTRVTPSGVTLISILFGLGGAWALALGDWSKGILFLNLWYLLDHVDGELARYRNQRSATGLFVDTIANFFLIPGTFFGLGFGLKFYGHGWLYVGFAAAYGGVMMMMISYYESAVLLEFMNKPKPVIHSSSEPKKSVKSSVFKKVFSVAHYLTTFPFILMILSFLFIFISVAFSTSIIYFLKGFILFYAILYTLVWFALIVQKVVSKSLDAKIGAMNG